jgi:hypothetical protein
MAVVIGFQKKLNAREPTPQPTNVVCHWSISPNRGLLQLDTFGSDERQIPGKQSQTLQLTVETARELMRILRDEFKL